MAGEGLIGIVSSVVSETASIGAITSFTETTNADVPYATASDGTANGSKAIVRPSTFSAEFTAIEGGTLPVAGDDITIGGTTYHITSTGDTQVADGEEKVSIEGTEKIGQPT